MSTIMTMPFSIQGRLGPDFQASAQQEEATSVLRYVTSLRRLFLPCIRFTTLTIRNACAEKPTFFFPYPIRPFFA